jgi:pSer/pThr/pTyr-binding forkhead associated (FHA) protein
MKHYKISVGRATLNDIVISSPEVSKFHCYFEVKSDGSLWVQDLGSSNGVFVNGRRISGGHALKPGDIVLLGKTRFFWEDELLNSTSSEAPQPKSAKKSFENRPSASPVSNVPRRNNLLLGIVSLVSVMLLFGVLWSTGVLNFYNETITEVTGKWTLKNDPIVYDTKCLTDSSQSNQIIEVLSDVKRDVLGIENIEVTHEEEVEVGRQFQRQIEEEYTYSSDPKYTDRVNRIFKKLLAAMENPRFQYECRVVESDVINAQTAGGQIMIFTGIIDFAENDDEIACIIGHEIYHNELGHLRDSMREMRLTEEWLGSEIGELAYMAGQLLTQSFNQENEVYSDLYGMDLAVKAGFDGCAGIAFWERMDQQSEGNRRGLWEKFSSTHPFSSERVACNRSHIDKNYYHTCH